MAIFMSEDLFVRQCAPTLAGLKTGSLFSCSFKNENEMKESVRSINRRLRDKGLRFIPMRFCGTSALLYLYRPEKLKSDLCSPRAKDILGVYGTRTSLRKNAFPAFAESFPHTRIFRTKSVCFSAIRRKM